MISQILDEPSFSSSTLIYKLKSLSPIDEPSLHFGSIDDLSQYISLRLYYGARLRQVIFVSGRCLSGCEELFEFINDNATEFERSLLISIASLVQFEEIRKNEKNFDMNKFLESNLNDKCEMLNITNYLSKRNLEDLFMYPVNFREKSLQLENSQEMKWEIISMIIIMILTTSALFVLLR